MHTPSRFQFLTRRFQAAFQRAKHDRERGQLAESLAQRWLAAHGLEVLAKNVVTPAAEIDLVCLENETLCLVEVKARNSDRYGAAIEAVSVRKQERLSRAAAWLCGGLPWYGAVRFDVLTLDRAEDQPSGFEVQFLRAAFEAPSDGEHQSR